MEVVTVKEVVAEDELIFTDAADEVAVAAEEDGFKSNSGND